MATGNIEDYIKTIGWVFYSTCGCGGTLHRKYKNPASGKDYLLDFMPHKKTFFIYLDGKVFKSRYDNQLKQILNELA